MLLQDASRSRDRRCAVSRRALMALVALLSMSNVLFYLTAMSLPSPPAPTHRNADASSDPWNVAPALRQALVDAQQAVDDARNLLTSTPADCECECDSQQPPTALPYLILGMPTVARAKHVDYLNPVLDSIQAQVPKDPRDPLFGRIQVYVLNNDARPDDHQAFARARTRFQGSNLVKFFVNKDAHLPDPRGEQDPGSPNKPGARVRKQTRHVVALARLVRGQSDYFMFMEDDFVLCPRTLRILHYVLNRAQETAPEWISLKVSYGMNGLVLKNRASDNDVKVFADYLEEHQARRPPDHLQTEFFAGETPQSAAHKRGRAHLAYRFNLLDHTGTTSSLRGEPSGKFAGCFKPLVAPVLFQVDAFKVRECGHDDLWPCVAQHDAKWQPTFFADNKATV